MAPDVTVVAARLATIEEALRFLGELAALPPEAFAGNATTYRAAERYLHLACEAVFDIGTHLLSSLGLERPARYADVIPALARAEILSAETERALADLAGFRNLLVHDYGRVDRRRVHIFVQTRLGDFRRFAQEISASLLPPTEPRRT